MMHLVDEAKAEAAEAIRAMQAAALHARAVHARAELLRHMRATAAKPGIDEATVAQEWMQAWGMADWPEVAGEMRGFVAAFCAYAAEPSAVTDGAVRAATAALEAALAVRGTTLADEMAWRSECAHGWWGAVRAAPDGYAARRSVPGVAVPFWAAGAAARCGG